MRKFSALVLNVVVLLNGCTALPIVDVMSGEQLVRALIGEQGEKLLQADPVDACCHDILDSAITTLGDYGKSLTSGFDLSKVKPTSYICTTASTISKQATCSALPVDTKGDAKWDVWNYGNAPSFTFKLFNVSFEVGGASASAGLCVGVSTCGKALAVSSDGAIKYSPPLQADSRTPHAHIHRHSPAFATIHATHATRFAPRANCACTGQS
jgi:hypothetical protein